MTVGFYKDSYGYHELRVGQELPVGAVAVPRLPEIGETWDSLGGAFVFDSAILADMSVPLGHIDVAHTLKMLEAAIILSGVRLTHGLLHEEAVALGVPVNDLAEQVASKSKNFRTLEVNRRVMKKAP